MKLLAFSMLACKHVDVSAAVFVTDLTCPTRAYVAVSSALLMSKPIMVSRVFGALVLHLIQFFSGDVFSALMVFFAIFDST